MPNNDPRADLRSSENYMKALIANVRNDQLGLPTPCSDWNVRQLMEHIVNLPTLLGIIGQGEALFGPSSSIEPDESDWVGSYDKAADFEWSVWVDDTVLDRQVSFPTGPMLGREAVRSWINETLVHAWDLATATGQTIQPPADVAERALKNAELQNPDAPQGKRGPFAPAVTVSPESTPLRKLAAWLGR